MTYDTIEVNGQRFVVVPESVYELGQRAIAAIKAHNDACQDMCGHGDQEAVACKYRPYFEGSHRRCPECPVYDMIFDETGYRFDQAMVISDLSTQPRTLP
jgi:hypothetical protein